MTGSAVPLALSALTTLWDGLGITNPQGTPLQVEDGPVYDPEIDFLAVGWDRSDGPAVSAAAQPNDAGAVSTYEQFEVSCLLSMFAGNSDLPTVRAAIFALFTQLKAAVAAHRNDLDEAIDDAFITTYDYTPDEGETGDQVDLRFTVRVRAYLT